MLWKQTFVGGQNGCITERGFNLLVENLKNSCASIFG